jgi:hypothetical protein
MDWIIRGFDRLNKRATGTGNIFQIIMELDGTPAEDELQATLNRLARKIPFLSGRIRRDFNLAPYWQVPGGPSDRAIALEVGRLTASEDVTLALEEGLNRPFVDKREHVAFRAMEGMGRSYVAATFDHCLFDAHGAEAFLGMVQREWETRGECAWEPIPPVPAHLDGWRRKFEAGRRVNRAFLRLGENAPPPVLPLLPQSGRQGFKARVICFTEQQTKEILRRADEEAGYLMAMPYTLAITVQVLHEIFSRRGITPGDYAVPVTIDRRPRGKPFQKLFFNQLSLFLFRIRASDVGDFATLVKSIKEQMYDQVKADLPSDLWEASFLLRILPPSVVSKLMPIYLKGEVASFCFSFLADSGQMPSNFMRNPIQHSFHMTRVPVPPGLGVLFHEFRGRLNADLSYANGLLTNDEVEGILDALRARLGGDGLSREDQSITRDESMTTTT